MKQLTKYDRFFFARIGEYNKNGDHGSTHLVQYDKDHAMLIDWVRGSWRYEIYILEQPI